MTLELPCVRWWSRLFEQSFVSTHQVLARGVPYFTRNSPTRPYLSVFLPIMTKKVSVGSKIQTDSNWFWSTLDHAVCTCIMTYFEIADLVLLVLLIFFRRNKFLIDFFKLGLFRTSKFLHEVGPVKELLKLLLNRHYGGCAATQWSAHFLSCFNQLRLSLDAFDLIETGLESAVHFISARLDCTVDKVEVEILSYSKQTQLVGLAIQHYASKQSRKRKSSLICKNEEKQDSLCASTKCSIKHKVSAQIYIYA